MKKNGLQQEDGISLIESLIVLTIAIIISTFALSNLLNPQKIMLAENVMREFKTNLDRAKMDSIRRNAKISAQQSFVSILSNNSYSIAADFNRNGTLEASEIQLKTLAGSDGAGFLLPSVNYPIKIAFDWRGRVTATDNTGAAVTTAFSYCTKNCSANAASSNSNSNNKYVYGLSLSPLGDAQILASTVTTVTAVNAPTVSNVSQNDIKSGTLVNVSQY